MKDMHAKPKDHLWVLVVIAAACGLEVCATWTGIGARSGFPVIRFPFGIPGEIPTDFCLMVCMEAYAYYALAIWLTRPGRRSGPFAMWSAIGAMALSLTGQVADHVTSASAIPPRWLVGFVSALPVLALFLGAILAHFVRTDRGEAEAAEREAAEARKRAAEEAAAADERTVLRAGLEAALAEVAPLREALEAERSAHARTAAKAEALARKTGSGSARKRRGTSPARNRNQDPRGTRNLEAELPPAPEAEPAAEETVDFDAEARILELLGAGTLSVEEGILRLVALGRTPSKAGILAGKSDSYGRSVARKAKELAEAAPAGQDPQEHS